MSIDRYRVEISSAPASSCLISTLLLEAKDTLAVDRSAARMLVTRIVKLLETADDKPFMGGLAPWQMKRVEIYIAENIARTVTLEQLADCAKLSASYFGRAFKATFGETPHAYVLRKRVELACRLMQETSSPLAEIALDCGMSDQSHLTRIFRRFTGMSPNAWRRLRGSEPVGLTARRAA